MWAPSVVLKDGLWWMVYTGVTLDATHNRTQRIGLAVSAGPQHLDARRDAGVGRDAGAVGVVEPDQFAAPRSAIRS